LIRVAIFLGYIIAISFVPDLAGSSSTTAPSTWRSTPTRQASRWKARSASRFSQLHVRCGTAFLLIVMVISIFVFAAVGTPGIGWLILSRIVGVRWSRAFRTR